MTAVARWAGRRGYDAAGRLVEIRPAIAGGARLAEVPIGKARERAERRAYDDVHDVDAFRKGGES